MSAANQATAGRSPEPRPLELRRATASDARFVYDVNNLPDVRSQSFSTASIPWESHEKWFAKKIEDPTSLLLVAVIQGRDAGVVRFDVGEGEAVIGVALAVEARGKGIGAAVIAAGTEEVWKTFSEALVVAFVRHENLPSQRAFERAGYRRAGRAVVKGIDVARFEARPGVR